MSYDISLDCVFDEEHAEAGGTYCVGGTRNPELDVTYNYAPHFEKVLGEQGIRTIYGMTAAASLPVLEAANRWTRRRCAS